MVLEPTNLKPRFFKSLLIISDNGVFEGTSSIVAQSQGISITRPRLYVVICVEEVMLFHQSIGQ